MTTTWTSISKSNQMSWNNIQNASSPISKTAGQPIGLLLALTQSNSAPTSSWTNVSKPTNTIYTNITKAS